MCLVFSLIPATMLTVVGFFVLFTASKAEGGTQQFGRVLAIWVFIVAAMIPMGGAYATFSDLCPANQVMEQLHSDSGQ